MQIEPRTQQSAPRIAAMWSHFLSFKNSSSSSDGSEISGNNQQKTDGILDVSFTAMKLLTERCIYRCPLPESHHRFSTGIKPANFWLFFFKETTTWMTKSSFCCILRKMFPELSSFVAVSWSKQGVALFLRRVNKIENCNDQFDREPLFQLCN